MEVALYSLLFKMPLDYWDFECDRDYHDYCEQEELLRSEEL